MTILTRLILLTIPLLFLLACDVEVKTETGSGKGTKIDVRTDADEADDEEMEDGMAPFEPTAEEDDDEETEAYSGDEDAEESAPPHVVFYTIADG